MAWNIILTSFAVIFAIMIVAQLLFVIFGDSGPSESGDES